MSGIVVGIDRSDTARVAAARAAELAARLGEPVHLVMAMKSGSASVLRRGSDEFVVDPVADGRQFLLRVAAELGATDATVAIGGKDPARSMCDEAARIGADMIVVGNRRVQGAARVLGSIAGEVTRSAPCDVLVVDTSTASASAAPGDGLRMSSAAIFAHCTPKQRQAIDELATPIAVRAGQELTREGRIGKEFGVLLDGAASVTVGGEMVATLVAGDHFGEVALLNGGGASSSERSATVSADGDGWVSIMSIAEFRTLVSEFPEIAERLRDGAVERVGGH